MALYPRLQGQQLRSILTTAGLARACVRRPWVVVTAWSVLAVAALSYSAGLGDVLTSNFDFTSEPESLQEERLVKERIGRPKPGEELVVVRSSEHTVDDPPFQAFVGSLVANIRSLDDVASSISYFETGVQALVSDDRHTTVLPVRLAGDWRDAEDHIDQLDEVLSAADGADGFLVRTMGIGSINTEFTELAESDLLTGETIGIPIAMAVLLLVFGALVAATVPLLLAITSIVVALGATTLIGQQWELSVFVVNMVVMIGLAVGIDYSLFIVERFREERAGGRERIDAVEAAGNSASRAVLFSGLTVVVALLGMLIVPLNVFRSLAAGAIIVVLVSVLAALTLLPAVLSLLGDRVDRLSIRFLRLSAGGQAGGFWDTTTRLVTTHPVVSVVGASGLLLAAASPILALELGNAGPGSFPEGNDLRQAFEIIDAEFSVGLASPTEIAIDAPDPDGPEVQGAIEQLLVALAGDLSFSAARTQTLPEAGLALVSVAIAGDPASDEAMDAVDRLRDRYIPEAFAGLDAEVLVGGAAPGNRDYFQIVRDYLPLVFVFVLALSFALLTLVFRSLVVPAKAILMNLLSVAAAYGLMVLAFKYGWGAGIAGFHEADAIDAWIPLFLFTVLFGLSMDYHVFLLSRIRERFDQTADNHGSVAFGLRSTGRIITGAAAIMVAVFWGFAAGDLVSFQQMGFGLGVAVLIDATLIRSVLVPASMELLGDWNWYLPRWLHWLPDVRVEADIERSTATVARSR